MGNLSRIRHGGEGIDDKQPSCMWGIIHVLDYHYWRSYARKIVHDNQYESATHRSFNSSPESKHGSSDVQEIKQLLDVDETNIYLNTKRSNRWSLKWRIKSLIAEDLNKEKYDSANEISFKSSLQRKDSVHHLESLGAEYDRICADWKHEVVYIPESVAQKHEEDRELNEKTDDILDILKVDKNLFTRQVHDTDKGVIDSSFDLNVKAKLSKSRSFPVVELSQGVKLKPRKLENKQKEVWPFPKEEKYSSTQQYGVKRSHRRILSLNESLEQNTKLQASRSLKFQNENGHGPLPFRKIRSLSSGGYYSSDFSVSIADDDITLSGLNITARDGRKKHESENTENVKDTEVRPMVDDLCKEDEIEISAEKELQDVNHVLDSETCEDETEPHFMEFQFFQDLENISYSDDFISSMNTNTETWLLNEKNCKKDHNSDMHYIQHLLEQSGISTTSDDQQLSTRIFEKIEASWPHDREELDGWPNFDGCWHHMMLFHLVNEVLIETYEMSLPYYPIPLSRSCHVRSLPSGKSCTEEVIAKIEKLVNAGVLGTETLDSIVSRDLDFDRSWMNLQFESERVGLEIEDIIFDEILKEIISPC